MRKALTVLAALAALTACGGTERNPARDADTGGGDDRPGSAAVYDRIEGASDCATLQQEFDTASASHDRADAGSEQADTATAYMEAADARMKELNCY